MRKTPSTFIDLTGARIGWWTVIERVPNRYKKAYFLCECRCGTRREVGAQQLREKRSMSCGCYGMDRKPRPRPEHHNSYWTEQEKEILRRYYPINGKRIVMRMTGRTAEAVNAAAKRFGVRVGKPLYPRNDKWSEGEITKLKRLYEQGGIRACEGQFRFRSKSAIKWKASTDLKLKSGFKRGGKAKKKVEQNDEQRTA